MVTRDEPWPPGTPCWADLGAGDVGTAKAFYAALFYWDIQDGPPEAGGYAMCLVRGRPVAGIGPKMGPAEAPAMWMTYLATDDADATAAKIKDAGGQLFMEPFEVMDVGRMAVAADPDGAVFGIWQARTHLGFGLANEPGAVIWNENMSRDFDRNKAFYQAVFGYEYEDASSEGFSYATIKAGGEPAGGIGSLGEPGAAEGGESHPYWGVYFAVDDADIAVAKVTDLGGTVVRPAADTPWGRMATLADTHGAVFSVMSMPEASGE
jgi:uncharacterized protein